MRLFNAALVILWEWRKAVFLVSLSLLSYGLFRHEPPPQFFPHADKFLHLAAFFGFSLCARAAFNQLNGWLIWSSLLLMALGSEWLQSYLQPLRKFSWGDIQANLLGVALALACYLVAACFFKYCYRAKKPIND